MTAIDIDVLRKTEAALHGRERELSQLVDMVPSHLWRLTPDGEPTFFNKRMVDFLGLDVADIGLPGMSRLDAVIETVVHTEDKARFRDAIRRSLATGMVFAMRYRLRRADGVYRWMSSRAEPMREEDGRILQWYGLCHDIDDQMHAEEALRRSEAQLRQMIDAVPVRIWSLSESGGPVYFNKRYRDYLRSLVENFDALEEPRIEQFLQDLVHPDDAPGVQRTLQNCFATKAGAVMRFRWREKHGSRWAECRVEPWRAQDGTVAQWYGVSIDIDEEMHALEALRASERELSLLVDMVPVNIGRMSPDGEPTFFSRRALASIGMDGVAAKDRPDMSRLAALIGSNVHPEDGPRMMEVMKRALAAGEPYSIQYRRRRADGVYRWMSGRAEPLRDQGGAIVQWYTAAIDIDDEVRAQEALRERQREREQTQAKVEQLQADFAHAARVSMLGELTASIAHEINQPLAAIAATGQASLNWLSRPTPDVERAKKLAEAVVADAQRAAEIIGRIRAMAAGHTPEQVALSLDDIIHEALMFLRHEVEQRGVSISHVPAPSPQKVLGDRTQLQQVIVNLAMNAVQAMAQPGPERRAISIRTWPDGPGTLRCSIEDSGPGIEPANLARLFDSFFTTKESGMGMGLRICRSVIEAHGGTIAADNESEHGGARFSFTLPIAADA